MPPLPRLDLPGIPLHVVQRGNNHQVNFSPEQDYTVYPDKLKHYTRQYQVAVHAYVLMTKHVHLLMTPATEKNVRQFIQSLSPLGRVGSSQG